MAHAIDRFAGIRQPLLADDRPVYRGTGNDRAIYGAVTAGGTFRKSLGAIEAFGIIISIVIGSGVFTSPGPIDTNVPSPGLALVVWLVGGLLAWTGAVTFAELGTALPGEGGVQPYLAHIYGPVFGFLAAWTWIVAIMPATQAILSIVFVETAYSALGVTDQPASIVHKLLSVLVLVVMSVANSFSTKASTRLNNFFVLTKFISIFFVVVAGLAVVGLHISHPDWKVGGSDWIERSWFAPRKSIDPDGNVVDWTQLGLWESFGHYSAALYAALWAYSGWDKAIYVTAELQQPAKQLPLAINTALPTAIISFLAANAAYYVILSWSTVSQTDSVAVNAITELLGQGAGIVTAGVICVVVAGSILGNSFVVSRMTVAAAKRNWVPEFLAVIGRIGTNANQARGPGSSGTVSETESDAPINAVILSTILSALYIWFGSFRDLLTLNGLGEYSFFFLTVLGAVILRFREPELARPYKVHNVLPFIFILVSGFVVVRGAVFAPSQAIIVVAIWGSGLAYYWIRMLWSYFTRPE